MSLLSLLKGDESLCFLFCRVMKVFAFFLLLSDEGLCFLQCMVMKVFAFSTVW